MTNKTNLELFKAAITEGLSNKYDSIVNEYTEAIECSERHKLAMRTIVYGKIDDSSDKKRAKLKSKHIIAIIVAAALLLITSCGIIFRNQIREVFRDLYVKLTYKDDSSTHREIDEVYMLTYMPEGYTLERSITDSLTVQYKYVNEENECIIFEQRPTVSSIFIVDSEDGYFKMWQIEEYDIYCRFTDSSCIYVWSDEKYLIKLKSDTQVSDEDIIRIIEGIVVK